VPFRSHRRLDRGSASDRESRESHGPKVLERHAQFRSKNNVHYLEIHRLNFAAKTMYIISRYIDSMSSSQFRS
jgi:hypothetical protein